MKRKDYEVIAEVLRNTKAPRNVVVAMAHKLESLSPAFKVDLFIAKCVNMDDIKI
jgi:hypothetical protein